MDKNKALAGYIGTYPSLFSWLYFNTINMSPGETAFIPDADSLLEDYIDGSQKREYMFSVAFMREYDTGTSEVNADALSEAQNFSAWIKEQDGNGIYPEWGDDNDILGMDVLTEIPLMTADQDAGVARYLMQLKITYLTQGKEI